MATWQRVSDWKRDVTLVSVADLTPLLAQEGWVLPADRVAGHWPRLAALAREAGFARVEADVAKRLRACHVPTHRIGYHRGSDGFLYRRDGPRPTQLDVGAGALLTEVVPENDDDAWDAARDELVDALIRIASEGALGERTVMIAAELPPLRRTDPSVELDADFLDTLEASEDGLAPREAPARLSAVGDALARLARGELGPVEDPAVIRKNLARSLGLALSGFLVTLLTFRWAPGVAAIAFAMGVSGMLLALLVKFQRLRPPR